MTEEIIVKPSDRSITKDVVFGHVMRDPKICLELLQSILPQLNLKSVKEVTAQRLIDAGLEEKSVRLDIMAEDNEGRLFDIEMQVVRQEYIGKRIRYYQSKMDTLTLKLGMRYDEIKDTYIIFLCPYDPLYRNRTRYEFSAREDHDPSIKLETGAHWIFLNSKGEDKDINKGLQQFWDLMNGKIDISSTFIARINKEIDNYVGSNEWNDDKVQLQTKLQDSERKGIEIGKKQKAIEDLKDTIQMLREDMGENDTTIFNIIKKRHHYDFSDEEIHQFIDETK